LAQEDIARKEFYPSPFFVACGAEHDLFKKRRGERRRIWVRVGQVGGI
jgi:hypothetical protein